VKQKKRESEKFATSVAKHAQTVFLFLLLGFFGFFRVFLGFFPLSLGLIVGERKKKIPPKKKKKKKA
jgi:hypothetical protein